MQSKQKSLSVIGKNYDSLTELDKKITSVAVGQNHFIYQNSKQQVYGIGSNKFGQLGIKQSTNQAMFYKTPTKIFQPVSGGGSNSQKIKNIFCGCEHTFVINEKNQVYSCGLNIKGQLGLGIFDNIFQLKLVLGLLPSGIKNPKANSSLTSNKLPTPPIIEALQKFDLQVKMQEQTNDKRFCLSKDQYIIQISCGALFTIALSSEGNIYGCGYQGLKSFSTHQDQIQKAKFKKIQIQEKIYRVTSGLSGSVAISKDNKFYIWGKYGKHNYNIPKRVSKQMIQEGKEISFIDCKVGDQFGVFLTQKGQIYTFGENFDNQLGVEQGTVRFRQKLQKVEKIPLMSQIFVGRNTVFCLSLDKSELFSWGSNKYGQLFNINGGSSFRLSLLPASCQISLQSSDIIVPSSYCTFFLTKNKIKQPQQSKKSSQQLSKKSQQSQQQMIPVSEYIRLMQQYKALKTLNLTLLQKVQPTVKKSTQDSQTYSKLELEGVTQYRKFNSNIEVKWSELQLQSQINQGGFGLIYKAKWRQITVIVKKFKIQNGDVSLRDFLSECHAMEAVRHPHIVMFLGAVTVQPHYSIILEYCAKGSLWSYLQNMDHQISWEEKRRFATEIAQGVLYLHLCSPPILHRDLKSLNIFLDSNLTIKIGDFGWTKALQNYMTNKIGTYQWMAPEVIGNKPYTQKADVFSFSIIMWEIASREPPYKNISGTKVSEDVLHRQLRPIAPKKTPDGWTKLMKRCWDKQPSKRPNFEEIIKELEVMKLS